jgi:hypothetical protein
MATCEEHIDINYDEQNDVLYASVGVPQAALSYEMTKDIWLDYVPPNHTVVGITVLNFLQHYPIAERSQLWTTAKAVVEELLRTYPTVPSVEAKESPTPSEEVPAPEPMIRMTPAPWLQICTSAAVGVWMTPPTQSVGLVALFEIPRIHWSQSPVKEDVA